MNVIRSNKWFYFVVAIFFWACGAKKKTTPSDVVSVTPIVTPVSEKKQTENEFFTPNSTEKIWIDSVYNSLNLEQKIGQLFMVAAYSNKDKAHIEAIDKLVEQHHIGGLIFFQGGPVRQAKLTNRYQSKSKIPLLIGIDAEWGLSMRLDSTYRYPWNMSLGAISNLELIEKTGFQMAEQAKRMGVHFTFAPVLDININPKNPIIGNRSFGEDKEKVTQKAMALMKGLQNNGILATGKHFPGHGDTDTDSHYALPIIPFDKERIENVELYPYKKLINEGLSSVMVAHLNVPSYEEKLGFPSSISKNIVTHLLKEKLHFKGLIFTDALNMKGASNFKQPGDIDLAAFEAGNDVLLFSENVPVAIQKIKMAIDSSQISEERLSHSVKKILYFKYKLNLTQKPTIALSNLYQDLNQADYDILQEQLYENMVTVVKNENEIVPIEKLEQENIGYIKMGDAPGDSFFNSLKQYAPITEILSLKNIDSLLQQIEPFSKIVIGFHKADGAWKKHDLTDHEKVILQKVSEKKEVVLAMFTKPYAALGISNFIPIESLIIGYQNNDFAHKAVAQIIFGANEAKGKLPVSITESFPVNHGIHTKKTDRLGYAVPERVGLDSKILQKIDPLVNQAIEQKIMPGAQILVAKKGKIVYQKSFGYYTYEKLKPVTNESVYDIASITKIVSTLPLLFQEFDLNHLNEVTTLGEMLPTFKETNKESITFKDLLSHQAGLPAWEPFYKKTLNPYKQPSATYYVTQSLPSHKNKVAENLFISTTIEDTIISHIKQVKLNLPPKYVYSDFTFVLLKKYLEEKNNMSLDKLIEERFYKKMGMSTMTYNPLTKIDKEIIVPTEDDTYFRYQRLQGYVHDMTAALEGGVGGHAGIFSNAVDVAKMMQLFLNKGSYGGYSFFTPKTFDIFNTCHYCALGNRRGLGLDKPQLGKEGPTCGCVPMTSFGHTGFTGTIAWADPEEDLIYIFLSNRTFPDSNAPNNLSKQNIREDIQKIIYEAIIK